MMNHMDDLPVYIVISGVFLTIIFGIITDVSFTGLMLRTIAATILFAVVGYIIKYIIRISFTSYLTLKEDNAAKEEINSESHFDISVPAFDESELYDYGGSDGEDDEFRELDTSNLNTVTRLESDEQ